VLYKDFDIEVIEDEPGKFKAAIRRPDGRSVRSAVPSVRSAVPLGPEVPVITTHLYFSAEDAMTQAKKSIDAGGIL
jgi:hypothetical protein